MTEFAWFRSTETGKTGRYPARFAESRPTLERIDASEAQCVDCWVQEDDELTDTETDTFGLSGNVLDLEDEDETENEDN